MFRSLIALPCRSSFTTACVASIRTSAANWKGHSKWQNIRHIKAEGDALKSAKIRQEMNRIRVCITTGGSADPAKNPALKSSIDLAIKNYVPKATIAAALKKANESPKPADLQRHFFECRLYGRVFVVFCYCISNLAQTRIQLNTVFRKHNAELMRCRHTFVERGVIDALMRPDISGGDATGIEDAVTSDAIDCGAFDVEIVDAAQRHVAFLCEPSGLVSVRHALQKRGYQIEGSEWVFEPTALVQINADERADFVKFIDRLNAIEGFDDIYDNIAAEGQAECG